MLLFFFGDSEKFLDAPKNLILQPSLFLPVSGHTPFTRRGRYDWLTSTINFRLFARFIHLVAARSLFLLGSFFALSRSLWSISGLLNLSLDLRPVLLLVILLSTVVLIRALSCIFFIIRGWRLTNECLLEGYLGERLRFLHFHLLHHLSRCIYIVFILFHGFSDLFFIGKVAIASVLAGFDQRWLHCAATWADRRAIVIDGAYGSPCALVSLDRFLIRHELLKVHLVRKTSARGVSTTAHAARLRWVHRCTAPNRLDYFSIEEQVHLLPAREATSRLVLNLPTCRLHWGHPADREWITTAKQVPLALDFHHG